MRTVRFELWIDMNVGDPEPRWVLQSTSPIVPLGWSERPHTKIVKVTETREDFK